MNTIWKILGIILLLVVVAFAGSIGEIVGKSTVETYSKGKKQAQLDSLLMRAASQLNENLPMMVDAETRWDNSLGHNKKFTYNYTLVNYSASELDPALLEKQLRPSVSNYACTSNEMKAFFQNGVSAVYAYRGKEGKFITSFTITPQECGY